MKLVFKIFVFSFWIFFILSGKGNFSYTAESIPPELEGIGVDEKLGHPIQLENTFKDEQGKEVQLRQYFDGKHPVILNLVYYGCPNLCGFLLNGFVEALKNFTWNPGQEFNIVTVSIDPGEKPELAAQKKEALLKVYQRQGANENWHFLTGEEAAIQKLANEVGFKYRYDIEEKQYAHSAVIFILTPDGKISRYLYGIQFSPRDLRLSLLEATQGKIGTMVDKFLLFCFHYDPKGRKYALMAGNLMKLGGVVTVLALASFLVFQLRSKKIRGF